MTNKTNLPETPENATIQKVVRRRCPLDASVLVHEMVDGLMGWNCPECGYFEPDPI